MPTRKYKCKNVAGGCEHAFTKDIIEIEEGAEFECPGGFSSCEAEEVTGKKDCGVGLSLWKKVAVLGGIVAVLGVGAAMLVRKEPISLPGRDNPVQSSSKPGSPANPCDDQAADPEDINRHAKGVEERDIVPVLAVQQCTAAVNEFPKEARFHFQLGRGLQKANRDEEAQKSFQTAVDLGSCAAKSYLGEVVLGEAASADSVEKAQRGRQLLEDASACGYGPAAARLQALTFKSEYYDNPKIMQALWDGRIDELNDARLLVALYCRGIHDYVSMEFHPKDQACPGELSDPTISRPLDQAVAGDPRAETLIEGPAYRALELLVPKYLGQWIDPVWKGDPEKYKNYFIGLGKTDAITMINKHGCLGMVTKHLYGEVIAFARTPRPFWDYKEKILDKGKELFGDQLSPEPPKAPTQ